MLATTILVFREVLEAALIISIVCAATRGLVRRGYWVSLGVVLGVGGAVALAFGADRVANSLEGVGQEIMNAAVLMAAVLMLAWHAIWMARHGRAMAEEMKSVGAAVVDGSRPLRALMLVVALAVLREGSEVVLFLFGIGAGGSSAMAMLAGGAIGVLAGATVGVVLYFGLLRIPIRHFFTATNWMVFAACRRPGIPGGAFSDPGRLAAGTRHTTLGQLLAAFQRIVVWPNLADPGWL